jgi:hypothetical protein
MTRSASATPVRAEGSGTSGRWGGSNGYLSQSERPLTSLVFLLPLILAYELGTLYFMDGSAEGHPQQIIAFVMMRRFFEMFGATVSYLPALAVVSVLLSWHVARGDAWTVRVDVLAGMVVESAVLAVPVLVIGYVLSTYLPLAAGSSQTRELVILSIGAGVYEELIFRLVLLNVLSLLLHNALQLKGWWVGALMVLTSGVLFSAYHRLGDSGALRVQPFLFRTLAGIYFALLFLARGFGITAASHAAYDVLIVMLTANDS